VKTKNADTSVHIEETFNDSNMTTNDHSTYGNISEADNGKSLHIPLPKNNNFQKVSKFASNEYGSDRLSTRKRSRIVNKPNALYYKSKT
jgi:hypothetical protein